MSVLLGFFHSNNNNNVEASPTEFTRTPSSFGLKRRQNRQKNAADGFQQPAEPPSRPYTPAITGTGVPAEKNPNNSSVTELKITPPFPVLRLSSLSLRSKSNPRISSRSPSPSPTPEASPVLPPSPSITRTNSNGDGLLSLCTGDYWLEDRVEDSSAADLIHHWTLPTSEQSSVTPEPVLTPRITVSTFMQSNSVMDDARDHSLPAAQGLGLTRSVSESIVGFARSWSPAVSRSSSPSSRDEASTKDGDSTTTASSTSSISTPIPDKRLAEDEPKKLVKNSRRASISSLSKKTRRPLSMMFTRAMVSDSMIALGRTQSISADNITTANIKQTGRKIKDELWDAFRTLESDYNKFQNKSSSQKAQVIRTCLMPFLRNTAHIICNNIEPDELDRRCRTLHRWWTGLLAQLQNRSASGISGADRPIYLEGISSIMSRCEWRPPQSEFAPLSQQLIKSHSSTSLSSDSSRYSVEKSVQHNVKSLFTRTIIDTLAFAVDKIAQRTAPASVVAFAGQVVAYAFFFCHGAAEVLISLWNIPPATVRRAVQELGIGRTTNMQGVFDSVVAGFPEILHPLGFTNLAGALKQLKKNVKPPLGNSVDWYGSWVNRWLGRDSDILFVFLKHYHILLCDFLPPDVSPTARICAPAFILIQSHLLNILDSAIHRQQPKTVPGAGPSLITFDDVLAKANALPVAANRTIGENKLVVLLRDVLTDQKQTCSARCRDILCASFSAMLVAAARRTKIFDSDACFALCDILEETLPILDYAEKLAGSGTRYIDWPFWIDVLKKMSGCDNNMTELRLICMVYTAWGLFVEDDYRKRAICLDWLLSPAVWEHFFCHWCPMVRAYYMRLICWRVVRYDGTASEIDQEILRTASLRLRTSFAHHARLKEKAEKGLILLPSATPCLPAPGRRLIILRNDCIVPPAGSFYTVDGLVAMTPKPSPPSTPIKTLAEAAKPGEPTTPAKKRWSILRSLGFQSDSPPTSPGSPGSISSDGDLYEGSSQGTIQRKAVFKFSLEWMAQQPFSVRDKHLSPARLPAATQAYLNSIMGELPGLVDLSDCTNLNASHWTYAGRALAEWVLVIVEYENFFERRKSEGKESDKEVETPTLGVESLRKI